MDMTPNEIRRNYNAAKDKKMQIGILADLNCCEKEDVEKILFPPDPVKEEPKPVEMNSTLKSLYAEMERLEKEIRELEIQYKNVTTAISVVSRLQEVC